MRFVGLVIVALVTAVALSHATARAATEFCPAELFELRSAPSDTVSTFHYRLSALSPRTVDATLIADTDRGWYAWQQPGVQLVKTTLAYKARAVRARYARAESGDLSVSFPPGLRVNHAWVTAAQTYGESGFGWDEKGKVTCAPPSLEPARRTTASIAPDPQPGDPTPPPATAAVIATPSQPPFEKETCDKPFASARVTDAMRPTYPDVPLPVPYASVLVYVAVDENGKLEDHWIFVSSGVRAFDEAALRAAGGSRYAPAVSYCYNVAGLYLFRADFIGHQ
jgi:TonB family protein